MYGRGRWCLVNIHFQTTPIPYCFQSCLKATFYCSRKLPYPIKYIIGLAIASPTQTVWPMASLSVNKGGLEEEGITCVSLGEWVAGVRHHGPYSVSREQGGGGRRWEEEDERKRRGRSTSTTQDKGGGWRRDEGGEGRLRDSRNRRREEKKKAGWSMFMTPTRSSLNSSILVKRCRLIQHAQDIIFLFYFFLNNKF